MNYSLKWVAQMGIFSNQAEFDAVSQFCSASTFVPTALHLSLNTLEDSYMPKFALIYTLKL